MPTSGAGPQETTNEPRRSVQQRSPTVPETKPLAHRPSRARLTNDFHDRHGVVYANFCELVLGGRPASHVGTD
jgi:hypothetical protein